MSSHLTLKKNKKGIELKGGMFTLFTIQLNENNLHQLADSLDEKINQAPNFFYFAPIILDLHELKQTADAFDFAGTVDLLKYKKLIPVGVRGATGGLKEAAIQNGLAVFPSEKAPSRGTTVNAPPPAAAPTTRKRASTKATTAPRSEHSLTSPTRVITQPIRSGQQIYVQGGDLIILGPVSSGAEVLADGHIHIYGPLRGRALAGVMGDKDALIFCRSLEAELVSVAGKFRASEDLKATHWKQSVYIQLKEECLNIFSV